MAVICTMTAVSFANETVVEACTQQLEGQNCSYSIAGSFVRHGVCQKIGPRNHSLLACLRTSSDPSDPACSRGLFHTASRACCASHCSFCRAQPEDLSERFDPACSVDHILRLSPSCSQTGAPCVVQSIFAGQKDIEKNTSATRNKRFQQLEGTPLASKQSHDGSTSVVSNLILPLMAGFILSGCSLTVLCYMVSHIWTQRTPQTPAPSPTSPTTKSCVGPGSQGSQGSKGPKSTSSRKERKERTSEKEKLDEELSDIKVTATKATKATPTETDDVLGELPDAWNLEHFKHRNISEDLQDIQDQKGF